MSDDSYIYQLSLVLATATVSYSIYHTYQYIFYVYVPGGLVDYPRAYYNQFREFNYHRVHMLVRRDFFLKKKKRLAESARA